MMKMMKQCMLMSGLCGMLVAGAQAGVPAPSFRYYGSVRNEYGWPVTGEDGLVLEVYVNGELIDRTMVNERYGEGVNYVLEAPCEQAGSDATRYAGYVVRPGDDVLLQAVDGTNTVPVMGMTDVPAVGLAGGAMQVNIQLGTDADGDGLSDRWEQLIVNNRAADDIRSIEDVHAGDDYDGDGVSNGDEFRAASSPVFAGDVFALMDFMRSANGEIGLCFVTVKGCSYRVAQAASPTLDDWQPVDFSLDPQGACMASYCETAGGMRYFYVPKAVDDDGVQVFRLEQL